MKEDDIVLTPIPQADGIIKNRPAIVLREMSIGKAPKARDVKAWANGPGKRDISNPSAEGALITIPD